MSRREARDSDSKRHRSRFDREPSPKRSRRDGKPETERVPNNPNLDSGNHTDRDQKHRRRLQDVLPLEPPLAPDSKVETIAVSKESDEPTNKVEEPHKKTNELKEFEKKPSVSTDPTEVPRSDSYFQHDKRGSAGHVDRSFGRRATDERGWRRDAKDRHDERTVNNRTGTNDTRQRDEKSHSRRDDNHVWRHDGFFEMEADPPLPLPPPPARRRPAFSEKKLSADSEEAEKTATEPGNQNHPDRPVFGSGRREERGSRNGRHLDRPERSFTADRRPSNRVEAPRGGPTKGYGGGGSGNYRERERFSGTQGNYRPGGRADKWKHDLFDEANRSPTRKNEEDQIAKVEALLSL